MESAIGHRKLITTILSNSIQILKGLIPLICIPLFLNDVIQGYWYTFTSLAALTTFADLGFMTIVGQFSAYEYSHLKLNKEFEGEPEYIVRLASLLKFVSKWIGVVQLVAFPVITIIGFCVLMTNGAIMDWLFPWLIYMFASLLSSIVSGYFAFFEGCDQISNTQINRIFANISVSGIMILSMYFGLGLYSLALSNLVGAIINIILLFIRFRRPLIQLYKTPSTNVVSWKKSFLSLIWKYALSWASGYFIVQIYTPLAYMCFDTVHAGKVGITITLIQSCMTLANSWNTIVTPNMNMYAANNEWDRMNKLEKKIFILTLLSCVVGYSILILFFVFFRDKFEIFDRFLGNQSIILLCFGFTCQVLLSSIAVYGRAHKIEPFMVPSLISAGFILTSTLILAYTLSIDYYFLGFAVSEFVSIIVFIVMYFKRRNKWHEQLLKQQELKVDDSESQNASQ